MENAKVGFYDENGTEIKEGTLDKLNVINLKFGNKEIVVDINSGLKSYAVLKETLDKSEEIISDYSVPEVTIELNGESFKIDTVVDVKTHESDNTYLDIKFNGYNKKLSKMLKIGSKFNIKLETKMLNNNSEYIETRTEWFYSIRLSSVIKNRSVEHHKSNDFVNVVFTNVATKDDVTNDIYNRVMDKLNKAIAGR